MRLQRRRLALLHLDCCCQGLQIVRVCSKSVWSRALAVLKIAAERRGVIGFGDTCVPSQPVSMASDYRSLSHGLSAQRRDHLCVTAVLTSCICISGEHLLTADTPSRCRQLWTGIQHAGVMSLYLPGLPAAVPLRSPSRAQLSCLWCYYRRLCQGLQFNKRCRAKLAKASANCAYLQLRKYCWGTGRSARTGNFG